MLISDVRGFLLCFTKIQKKDERMEGKREITLHGAWLILFGRYKNTKNTKIQKN